MTTSTQTAAPPQAAKLGTFGGVFTPNVLTILGLVLFLRLGFVTGNVGLLEMLAVVGLATSVSLLTSVSLAAMATNLRVGGGGVYFLISRTLGPAYGGAIGLVLYAAMSVSIAFYAIGLGEAVASIVGTEQPLFARAVAAAVIVGLVGLAWLGADVATRFQYVVMACLVLALIGFFVGVIPSLDAAQLGDNLGPPETGLSFWQAFPLFFPAITGFTQGVAMSGDLATPGRSITRGTFAAVGLSTLVYLAVVVSLAAAVSLEELQSDTSVMRSLALHPALIDVGVIAATLSSAIASILGAPRTLQRLAADRLIEPLRPFALGSGPSNNPRRAMLLSAAVAMATVAAGDLDFVAPIISMFFLTSYGLINYATYAEARAQSTSFRPTFKWFDWRLSLVGTVACVGVIVAINPLAGALAGLAVLGLQQYLQRTVQQVRWADSTRGFHTSRLRSHLRQMAPLRDDQRDWRPFAVVFAPKDYRRRTRLTEVASWVEGGTGFTTVARIIPGTGPVARRHAAQVELELGRELAYRKNDVDGRVVVAADVEAGVAAVLQAHGLGRLRPNLALFSSFAHEAHGSDRADAYRSMVQTAVRFGCNVGVVTTADHCWVRMPAFPTSDSAIVVWWSDDANGRLLTLLAWMCTRSPAWSGVPVRVWVERPSDGPGVEADSTPTPHRNGSGPRAGADGARSVAETGEQPVDPAARVAELLSDARIPAEVVGAVDAGTFLDRAAEASLVFAPLRVGRESVYGPGDVPVADLKERLPVTVFVQAAAEVPLDAQPDDGPTSMLAEATDRANEATGRANELDAEAARLMVEAEMIRMEHAGSHDAPEVTAATDQSRAAYRRYLDARARADEAWRLVAEIDPMASTGSVDPEHWVEAPKPTS